MNSSGLQTDGCAWMTGAKVVRHSSKVDAARFMRTESGLTILSSSSAVTGVNLLMAANGDQTVCHAANRGAKSRFPWEKKVPSRGLGATRILACNWRPSTLGNTSARQRSKTISLPIQAKHIRRPAMALDSEAPRRVSVQLPEATRG